jgi:hypothetical protein
VRFPLLEGVRGVIGVFERGPAIGGTTGVFGRGDTLSGVPEVNSMGRGASLDRRGEELVRPDEEDDRRTVLR